MWLKANTVETKTPSVLSLEQPADLNSTADLFALQAQSPADETPTMALKLCHNETPISKLQNKIGDCLDLNNNLQLSDFTWPR